ncbi:MAG: twin-arginine translocase TatA/TatE family subunit [Alphaproteobacteria bacterium]|nr:twin-arginine translocase TatA/TatE family subunit [Alphaproteobacteria bacterium]
MGSFSIWHWLIVLVIVVLLFGRNRIPAVMGDLAKGIKAFKSGMKEEKEDADATPPKAVGNEPMAHSDTILAKDKTVQS